MSCQQKSGCSIVLQLVFHTGMNIFAAAGCVCSAPLFGCALPCCRRRQVCHIPPAFTSTATDQREYWLLGPDIAIARCNPTILPDDPDSLLAALRCQAYRHQRGALPQEHYCCVQQKTVAVYATSTHGATTALKWPSKGRTRRCMSCWRLRGSRHPQRRCQSPALRLRPL